MRMILLPVLLFLAACTAGPDAACRLERLAELPLDVVNNVPLVTVDINGAPARLVLDTGADRTVLTRTALRRLNIPEGTASREIGGAGGRTRVGSASIERLSVGSLVVGRHAVLVADAPAPPLDGLLGIDVLVDYEMELDIPHRRAALYRARSCITATPDWPGRIIRLPVQQQAGSGHLFVSMEVDGQPLRGMLDSGASGSTLSLQSAEDAGLRRRDLAALPRARGQAVNPGGLLLQRTRFRQLRVGTDTLDNPMLTIADLPAYAGDLLVGADYIGSRKLWFSFRLGRVFVSPE